ncbi:MAG: hypothetical protein JWN95_2691 [Frankiales bacterium]|nr:hypothetical protein [Frankiales bacterium]
MDQIEPDALYDERTDVSRARPLLQGDVFDGVALPGFGDTPMKVQVVAHPCAMRTGANLTPRITVAPVAKSQAVTGNGWEGNLRVMPLAELIDGKNFATKLVDVTACPAELLTREHRIATLSHRGIYVLQQRIVKHYTRLEMPLELLRRESAPVLTEAEIQQDWLEAVLTDAELDDDDAIAAEAGVFEEWLREGTPSRQRRLRTEIHHADVRREAQRAATQRAQERETPGQADN